jgi:dihydrofolate reductase
MIKIIVTIDSARGLKDSWGLPAVEYYQAKKLAIGHLEPRREPFERLGDIDAFFGSRPNIWVVGGSKLYEQALPYADQLFITQINGLFECDSYFPKFEDNFVLRKRSRILNEHGIEFQHQLWVNKSLANTQDARNTDTRDS